MRRNTVALASLLSAVLVASLAFAVPREELADGQVGQIGPRAFAFCGSCSACTDQTPILEGGRPPLPGEEGTGVQSCTLVNTSAEWDRYCSDNVIPDCPLLDDSFFAQRTVVAVAIDTLTARPCEGSPDPLWRLDCVTTPVWGASVRVVKQRPVGWCHCSAMPQQVQRLFLASATPKIRATACRTCEEQHKIGCLN